MDKQKPVSQLIWEAHQLVLNDPRYPKTGRDRETFALLEEAYARLEGIRYGL